MRSLMAVIMIVSATYAPIALADTPKPFQKRFGEPIVQSYNKTPLWPGFTRHLKRNKLKVRTR